MVVLSPDRRSRAVAAVAALVFQAGLAWLLITGLSAKVLKTLTPELAVFDVAPVAPPKPPVPVRHAARRAAGAAAPPHARADPTPVIAPLPTIILPPPPPLVVAAPVVARGSDNAAGAADRGSGSGAGGEGDGRGSGGAGNGTGSGGTPAEYLRGEIRDRDYPRALRNAGIEGRLTTRYVIDRRGRIAQCTIVKSSGHPELDALTCRLVQERFRFAPARDADGRPVEEVQLDDHHWGISATPVDDRPDDGAGDDRRDDDRRGGDRPPPR